MDERVSKRGRRSYYKHNFGKGELCCRWGGGGGGEERLRGGGLCRTCVGLEVWNGCGWVCMICMSGDVCM